LETAVNKKAGFDVIGNIIAPLAVILMEVFWVYPWLIWSRELEVFPWDHTPLNIFSLLVLIISSYVIARFVPSTTSLLKWGKLALVLIIIGIIIHLEYTPGMIPFSGTWLKHMSQLVFDSFTTLHAVIPAITASVYLCWRGMRIGSSSTFSSDIYRSFLFGLIGVILLIIIWAAGLGTDSSLISLAGLYIAGFFFFGLLALALGNFLNVRQKLLREQSAPLSSRRWLTILFSVIGGMVLVGFGIASLFSPELIEQATGAFGDIVYRLNYALEYLVVPIGYIFEVLWYIMAFIFNLLRSKTSFTEFEFPGMDEIEGFEEALPAPTSGFDYMIIVKWAVVILIIAFVIFFLYKAAKRFQSKYSDSGVEEYSESLWSWLGFTADIRLFFSRLFESWFGSRIKRLRSRVTSLGRTETVYPDDMDIREIYRHILEESGEAGFKHHSYETPYEYAGRLDATIPGIDEQVDDITELYVSARYGEARLKEWEAEHANVLFRLLRRVLRKPERKPGDPFIS
jgi:large-conductance mechanosensitive channel